MTKNEALRLALEALEDYQEHIHRKKTQSAITAIKAALEAKDKPVAWMREDGTLHFADKNIFYVGQPFYTTPPQRKPLTDEQTNKAAMKLAECMDYPWTQMPEQGKQSMRIHAKAVIEAAHGIKGEA